MNKKKQNSILRYGLIVILLIPIASIFYCHPISTGITIQRNLLSFYGLSKKKLVTEKGNLVYFEGGKGPTLILVHGYITEAGNWYRVVPDLIKNYHLILPDLPGHGDSDPQGDILTPEDLLYGLNKIIDEMSKNGKIILLGNSLGGWVSLMSVLQNQDNVSMLILENSAGLKTPLPERLLLPKDVESAKELYQILLGDEAPNAPNFLYKNLISYLGQPRFTYLFKSIKDKYFLDNKLSSIHIPVYLIWGGEDKLFPHEYALRLEKQIPGSKLITINSTGHAMHFTQPQKFIKILQSLTLNLKK